MSSFDENWVRQDQTPIDSPADAESLMGAFHRSIEATLEAFVIGRKNNVIAYSDSPRLYSAGDNPALVKSIDILDSKPQGTVSLRAAEQEAGRARAKGLDLIPFRNTAQRLEPDSLHHEPRLE